jgi:hypothetical protein
MKNLNTTAKAVLLCGVLSVFTFQNAAPCDWSQRRSVVITPKEQQEIRNLEEREVAFELKLIDNGKVIITDGKSSNYRSRGWRRWHINVEPGQPLQLDTEEEETFQSLIAERDRLLGIFNSRELEIPRDELASRAAWFAVNFLGTVEWSKKNFFRDSDGKDHILCYFKSLTGDTTEIEVIIGETTVRDMKQQLIDQKWGGTQGFEAVRLIHHQIQFDTDDDEVVTLEKLASVGIKPSAKDFGPTFHIIYRQFSGWDSSK